MMVYLLVRRTCSGVNTPIPKMQMAYREPMALASHCSGLKPPIPNIFRKVTTDAKKR